MVGVVTPDTSSGRGRIAHPARQMTDASRNIRKNTALLENIFVIKSKNIRGEIASGLAASLLRTRNSCC
jgi:hypothetical protein